MAPGPLRLPKASGRPSSLDYRSLSPRTPHSRAGRAEEAMSPDDLDDEDANQFASYRQQQAEPLLASSASTSFPSTGYRSRGDGDDSNEKGRSRRWKPQLNGKILLTNAPLIISLIIAGILLVLIVMSFRSPETLEAAIGATVSPKVQQHVEDTETKLPVPTYVDTVPDAAHLISYVNYTQFPLTGPQYRQECNKLMGGKFMHHAGFWDPPHAGIMDVPHHDDVTDYHLPEGERTRVCTKTITYQLDGTVGLVADLALMAQAAALARERNRTFLVDDTYWNRGKWTDHFQNVRERQPGPEPGCRAPPPEELVACPRLARHWVVNARTALYHFSHGFDEHYENPYKRGVNRKKPIFESSLQSFRETIRPNTHNAQLIRAARTELSSLLSLPPHSPTARNDDVFPPRAATARPPQPTHIDPYIAVHIRRGDKKAGEFPYRGSYVPLENFVTAARDAWARFYHDDVMNAAEHFPAPPIAYVASDSHAAAHDFVSAFPASTAMFSLDASTDPDLRALAPQSEHVHSEFVELSEQDRVRLTRGMVVDFAMLSGLWAWEGDVVPGATICTFSSTVCRLSALGLGWNRAFGFDDGEEHPDGTINKARKRWIDLDNKGSVEPAWTAFDMF